MSLAADMTNDLKRSIIILVSLMILERIINAEDDDDLALAKINKLFRRNPRMITLDYELPISKDFNNKRELESKLGELLEFQHRGPAKWQFLRQDSNEETESMRITTSEVSPFMRFDPVDKRANENTKDETVEDDTDDNETQETTKHSPKNMNKHAKLIDGIRRKITDKNTKLTVSLPVAAIIVGSIILVTCCCSLYLQNCLVACINTVTGKKKRKSKMLFVDTERGRSAVKTRKKSVTSSRKRARSLSHDTTNMATQKSSTMMMENDNDEPSTTGCYRCCKKKKKRGKKNKK